MVINIKRVCAQKRKKKSNKKKEWYHCTCVELISVINKKIIRKEEGKKNSVPPITVYLPTKHLIPVVVERGWFTFFSSSSTIVWWWWCGESPTWIQILVAILPCRVAVQVIMNRSINHQEKVAKIRRMRAKFLKKVRVADGWNEEKR